MRGGIRSPWALAGVCLVSLAFLAVAVPTASAQCGGVETAYPAHHPRGQRPPLAIGDSTMLLALQDMANIGYEANAHGCREWGEAMGILRARRAADTLPHMVVIALGADGSVTSRDVGAALGVLCCTHLLVLVTNRELGGGSGSDATTERAEAAKHRNRAKVLDWVRYSAGHGGWFQPDGLHLTDSGAVAFTHLMAMALPWAYPKPKPKRHASLVGHPAPTGLTLTASLGRTGYVGATITGPAVASVQLDEIVGATTKPVATVALGPAGRASVPSVLTWSCARRERELVASTVAPAAPAQATAAVTTPACSRRLSARISATPRAGPGDLEVRVRDRWGLGALTFSICVTPPGARSQCGRWQLGAGEAARLVTLAAPRPGGWGVSVSMPYGRESHRLLWFAPEDGGVRLLAAGDSEMQEVDDFMRQDLGPDRVRVTEDARISTGLTNSFFFDWPAHARRQAPSLRPDVTVMFMGGNEGFPIRDPHGQLVGCCGADWSAGYALLVAEMMRSYLRGQAGRVYWFLLPAPRQRNFQSTFDSVNAGIRIAARRFPGRVGLIDANAFFTPGNRYRDFMTYRGRGFVIHESDGVHLSTAANAIAASLVAARLRADRVIR
jgi:hypothetical protein